MGATQRAPVFLLLLATFSFLQGSSAWDYPSHDGRSLNAQEDEKFIPLRAVPDEASSADTPLRGLLQETGTYPPAYPPPPPLTLPSDPRPTVPVNETTDPPAGTGEDEATTSSSQTTIVIPDPEEPIGNLTVAERKERFVNSMLEQIGGDGSITKRKENAAQTLSQHRPLRRLAETMLEDALRTAPLSNAGRIRFSRNPETSDIDIDITLFYPAGTSATDRQTEANNANARIRERASTTEYTDALEEAVDEAGTATEDEGFRDSVRAQIISALETAVSEQNFRVVAEPLPDGDDPDDVPDADSGMGLKASFMALLSLVAAGLMLSMQV